MFYKPTQDKELRQPICFFHSNHEKKDRTNLFILYFKINIM